MVSELHETKKRNVLRIEGVATDKHADAALPGPRLRFNRRDLEYRAECGLSGAGMRVHQCDRRQNSGKRQWPASPYFERRDDQATHERSSLTGIIVSLRVRRTYSPSSIIRPLHAR